MPRSRKSAVRSGILTGLSSLAVSGSAAVAYALLAHRFGRTVRTDGFLAAYTIYLALALAAQAFRIAVVPELTRAETAGRLAAELRGYLLAFLTLAVPICGLVAVFRHPLGDAITAEPGASAIASRALVWVVAAGFGQLLGAVCVSALAVRDEFGIAALAYSAGAVANVAIFAALSDTSGLISLAWGVAANAAIVCVVPLVAFALREGMARGAPLRVGARLALLLRGVAVPFAIQGLVIVAQRFAAGLGAGTGTTFVTAYLIGAVLVTATASSVALISSAPLTRRGIDAPQAAQHVVHATWLSVALVAAATGVFALVGGRLSELVLGSAYGGGTGRELGRLVAYLAPWMLAAIAYTATFPLVFVMERGRFLYGVALGALVVHVPVTWALREAFGLPGIALALAATTFGVTAALMAAVSPRMLVLTAEGLARLSLQIGALALVCFGGLALLLGGIPSAAAALVLYAALLAALRPRGLREAWAYVRALH
jgi:hypothetical protein